MNDYWQVRRIGSRELEMSFNTTLQRASELSKEVERVFVLSGVSCDPDGNVTVNFRPGNGMMEIKREVPE